MRLRTKKAPPAGRRAAEAMAMAARLLSLAGLRPEEDYQALVVTTAPRSPEEAASPHHRRSYCAKMLCAAEEAARHQGRDGELFPLARYFLDELPALPRRARRRLDRRVAGG